MIGHGTFSLSVAIWQRPPNALFVFALSLTACFFVSQLMLSECTTAACRVVLVLFDLGGEANLPTWFSSSCWLLMAILSLFAARRQDMKNLRLGWVIVALIAVYISVDETAMLHETFGGAIGSRIVGGAPLGIFHWQVYGVLAVCGSMIVLAPFAYRLPAAVRNRLILAACVFILAALGMETIEAKFFIPDPQMNPDMIDPSNWVRMLRTTVEELGEMIAIIIAISAVIVYLLVPASINERRTT